MKLEKQKQKWIDIETEEEFHGRVVKDLKPGDEFSETLPNGKIRKTVVARKEIMEDGSLMIVEHITDLEV